jgi:type VI secretion system protein ImpA
MSDLPEGFDIEALAAPIAGDVPVGPDLREDTSPTSPFYRMKDAVASAREADKETETKPDAPGGFAQWRQAMQIGRDWLKRSKSLVPAVHMTEALVRSDGFNGLRAGTLLLERLVAEYWDNGLYPQPEDGDIGDRTFLVGGLNTTLLQPLQKVPLFQMRNGEPAALWRFKQSLHLNTFASEDPAKADPAKKKTYDALVKGGAIPFEQFEQDAKAAGLISRRELPPGAPFLADVRAALVAAHEAWVRFAALIDEKAGSEAPALGKVTEVLDQTLEMIDRFAPGLKAAAAAAAAGAAAAAADANGAAAEGGQEQEAAMPDGATGPLVQASGRVRNREEALRVLTELSEFFERTEPHSPLAYTLRDAVRRGRMPLAELLAEVLPDANARKAMLTQLGIKPE